MHTGLVALYRTHVRLKTTGPDCRNLDTFARFKCLCNVDPENRIVSSKLKTNADISFRIKGILWTGYIPDLSLIKEDNSKGVFENTPTQ